MPAADIPITESLTIASDEVSYTTARSAGPGGQHVNKTDSRVTLVFDLAGSASLSEEQKARAREHLGTRISKAGTIRVASGRHRSQFANKQEVVSRFARLLSDALKETPPRRPTAPTAAARRKRLDDKRRRARLKHARTRPQPGED
jgi:ribosome-associated protein